MLRLEGRVAARWENRATPLPEVPALPVFRPGWFLPAPPLPHASVSTQLLLFLSFELKAYLGNWWAILPLTTQCQLCSASSWFRIYYHNALPAWTLAGWCSPLTQILLSTLISALWHADTTCLKIKTEVTAWETFWFSKSCEDIKSILMVNWAKKVFY